MNKIYLCLTIVDRAVRNSGATMGPDFVGRDSMPRCSYLELVLPDSKGHRIHLKPSSNNKHLLELPNGAPFKSCKEM
jgi:hypothetical protein